MSGRQRFALLAFFAAGCGLVVWLAGREDGSMMVAGLFVVLVMALSQERR